MEKRILQDLEKLEQETIARYREVESELLEALRRVQTALTALGAGPGENSNTSKVVPPLEDLRIYLRQVGRPASQYDIIREVGIRRRRRYPELLRPFNDVWKSLEYHNRHNREIVCVEWVGDKLQRAKLKPRKIPPRVGIGAREDAPELYREPENLFWFLDEIDTLTRKCPPPPVNCSTDR